VTLTDDEIVAVAALWRAAGREVVTSFQGTSMLPTIGPGAEVILDCGRDWQVGDIIAFVDTGHLAVHRIVAASADRKLLLTRGDNRTIPDDPFEAAGAVIGVITRVRAGDDWIAPAPVRQSRLRARVLRSVVESFNVGRERCVRRLKVLRTAASLLGLNSVVRKAVLQLVRTDETR